VLPFERPFVVAHEWSHLAGIADEGEANFTGWLACVRGSAPNAYSGWLFLYGELARVVSASDRASLSGALAAGPRADLRAMRERYEREVSPGVSRAEIPDPASRLVAGLGAQVVEERPRN
jgi:hypothetical protein